MIRRWISILIVPVILLLPGCMGSNELKGQINVIQQQLLAEDWNALEIQMDRFTKLYDNNEWKLQLLGDEGEYETLHESILRLQAAIEIRDYQMASLELATIKSLLADIYSL